MLFWRSKDRGLYAMGDLLSKWIESDDAWREEPSMILAQHRWSDPRGAHHLGEVLDKILRNHSLCEWLQEVARGERQPVYSKGPPEQFGGGSDLLRALRSRLSA